MTEAEKTALISLCTDLAKKFAPRAAKYDREASFPVENYDDLKAAGLLGIMVPKEKGGMGADFLTYTKALEQLAMGDASTALTFNMHNITAGSLAEVDTEGIGGSRGSAMNASRDWMFKEMVEGQKLFASASSEPGIGAHFSKIKTNYEKVEGGYKINGAKSFVSMAGHADYYVVVARKKGDTGEVPQLSFFIIEKENPGIEIERVWDVLGMRATSSDNMFLKDVFVPDDRLFLGSEGMGAYKITREPHWVIGGYVGAYMGVISATFEFMINHLQKKKMPGTDKSIVNREWIQHTVGELYVEYEAVKTVVYDVAQKVVDAKGTAETNTAMHRSKFMVSEFAPKLASHAIRICGGSSIAKRLPLERLFRDARCGGLMPATSDECLLYAGKSALGFDLTKLGETYW